MEKFIIISKHRFHRRAKSYEQHDSLFLVHFFLSFPKCHIISVLFINGPMAESKTDVPYKEKKP